VPELTVDGPDRGELLVLGWGSTYGAIAAAMRSVRRQGLPVAVAHLRYLNPLPRNLGGILACYKQVLVPELNTGQLRILLQAQYLVEVRPLNKVQGQPFAAGEIAQRIEEILRHAS
jgi:2-oxoglutarate ferredoxin oxidoreductase subunit alpha